MEQEVKLYYGHEFVLQFKPRNWKWICSKCNYSTSLLETMIDYNIPLSLTCDEKIIKKLLE